MATLDWLTEGPAYEALQPWGTFMSGACFGSAWWVFADAVAYSALVLDQPVGAARALPGVVATLAVLLMCCSSYQEVRDGYGDEGDLCRSRAVLFLSYLVSVVAIVWAVSSLLVDKHNDVPDLWVSTSGVVQCALLLLSGMVNWLFRSSSSDNGYGMM